MYSSCSVEDMNSEEFSLELATVNLIDQESGAYYLTLDDGSTLKPTAYDIAFEPKANQRVKVNYTIISSAKNPGMAYTNYDHTGKINYIQNILTKPVIELTAENEKEVGNDPVKLLDFWIGDHYLNIHFGINMSGAHAHTFNLVKNTLIEKTNTDNEIVLEFRHNTNGDTQLYGRDDYAAFDLRSLQVQGKNKLSIKIKIKNFDLEEKEYKIEYKY